LVHLFVVLLLLSMFVAYSIPLLRSTFWLHQVDTDLPVLFGILGGAVVAWPVVIWIARKRSLGSLQQNISWACPNRVFAWAFVAGFVLGIAYSFAKSAIVGRGYRTEGLESILAFVVLAGLLQPILEEVYFRGILFTALAHKVGTIPGVIVVTLLFSFLHPKQFLTVLPVAILLGGVRIYTGSVRACFACHAAYNLSLTLFMLPINR
jgi:membrane protease YdiL (CAAX protease family)